MSSRHKVSNETPLTIYLGLELYAHKRKRQMIDTMLQLVLSISYDIVLGISTQLGNSACQQYQTLVCPLKFHMERWYSHFWITTNICLIQYHTDQRYTRVWDSRFLATLSQYSFKLVSPIKHMSCNNSRCCNKMHTVIISGHHR